MNLVTSIVFLYSISLIGEPQSNLKKVFTNTLQISVRPVNLSSRERIVTKREAASGDVDDIDILSFKAQYDVANFKDV